MAFLDKPHALVRGSTTFATDAIRYGTPNGRNREQKRRSAAKDEEDCQFVFH